MEKEKMTQLQISKENLMTECTFPAYHLIRGSHHGLNTRLVEVIADKQQRGNRMALTGDGGGRRSKWRKEIHKLSCVR